MGRKPNTPLSNIANNGSPNNLNWKNAKHGENLMYPQCRQKLCTIHSIRQKRPEATNSESPKETKFKGTQPQIDLKTEKINQVARKAIKLATKVKDPKTFEQKYKTVDEKLLTYTPNTAWVQKSSKQPRLLRHSGFAFMPNTLIYGPCRPVRLNDYVAYKPARGTGPCLCIVILNSPRRPYIPS